MDGRPLDPSVHGIFQEYRSGLPLPTPGDILDPEIALKSLASPASAGGFFITAPPGKPHAMVYTVLFFPFTMTFAGCNHG